MIIKFINILHEQMKKENYICCLFADIDNIDPLDYKSITIDEVITKMQKIIDGYNALQKTAQTIEDTLCFILPSQQEKYKIISFNTKNMSDEEYQNTIEKISKISDTFKNLVEEMKETIDNKR